VLSPAIEGTDDKEGDFNVNGFDSFRMSLRGDFQQRLIYFWMERVKKIEEER
jgi:hypothetical protein